MMLAKPSTHGFHHRGGQTRYVQLNLRVAFPVPEIALVQGVLMWIWHIPTTGGGDPGR